MPVDKDFWESHSSRPARNGEGNFRLSEEVEEAASRMVDKCAKDDAEADLFKQMLGLSDPDVDYDEPVGAPTDV